MIYWIHTLLSRLSKARPRYLGAKNVSGLSLAVLVFPLFLVAFIWQQDPLSQTETVQQLQGQTSVSAEKSLQNYAAHGDLAEIRKYGRLRVLLKKRASASSEPASSRESRLIREYAQQQGLQLEWSEYSSKHLLSALEDGSSDIVLHVTRTPTKDEKFQLTLPWGVSQQQIVFRSDTGQIRDIDDLKTRQIAIKRSSSLWKKLLTLQKQNPSMDIIEIPEQADAEDILEKVASAQYDVTVMDNLIAAPYLPKYLNLEIAFNASEAETISWAIRSDAKELQASLNSFLNKQYLQADIVRTYQEDLPDLQLKKLLRVVTYQSPVNYYLHKGKLKGFEYDLLKRFSESQQMRLDVVIADSHEEMREMLLEGKGDVVAASLPRVSVDKDVKLSFTRTYSHAAPVVIGRSKDTPILDVRGLSGRRIILPAASPYENILRQIKSEGVDMDIIVAEAGETTERVLFRVAQGMYDLTVVGGLELKAQLGRQINLRAHFALTEPLPHVWAVRKADTQLLTALNDFIKKEFRKGFYNVLYSKYIDKPPSLLADTQLLAGNENLSPYDDIVHKYAEHYSFDWRLIVAQMYQESQFDPYATSYAGAEGLMQIIPETAELLGISDVNDPDKSIQAGIRYMHYLRGKFEDELMLEDRLWFSLAAYNAGYSRVHRARLLAVEMNLDQNKWFDNVEKAMLSLATPYRKDGQTVRNCRCGQTVVYVRNIKTLYNNYVRLTRDLKTVSNATDLTTDI